MSTLRAWSASSCTSTSCRASTTARPTSRPRSSSPARRCATGRGWSRARRMRRSWTWPRFPSGCASCASRWRDAGVELEVRTGAELSWYDVPDARRRAARDGRPGPARPALAAARGAAAGHRHARRPAATARRSCAIAATACSSAIPSARPRSLARPAPSRRLLAAGDRLQVNGSSLTGYHGAGARAAGLELIEAGRATVIASDAHRPSERARA